MFSAAILILLAVIWATAVVAVIYYTYLTSQPNPPLVTHTLVIGPATLTVELADTILKRMRGLSYRPQPLPGRGMLFIFQRPAKQAFWMKGVQSGLDFIWIRAGVVVGITPDVPPPANASILNLRPYRAPEPVDAVLEIGAGECHRLGILVGQKVALQ